VTPERLNCLGHDDALRLRHGEQTHGDSTRTRQTLSVALPSSTGLCWEGFKPTVAALPASPSVQGL
jgi:hypothetical protein